MLYVYEGDACYVKNLLCYLGTFSLCAMARNLIFSVFYYTLQNYDFGIMNLSLIANIGWSFDQIPGGWSISNEWIYSLFLITLGVLTKQKLFFLLTLCMASQLVTGFWVWNMGGVKIENVEQMKTKHSNNSKSLHHCPNV